MLYASTTIASSVFLFFSGEGNQTRRRSVITGNWSRLQIRIIRMHDSMNKICILIKSKSTTRNVKTDSKLPTIFIRIIFPWQKYAKMDLVAIVVVFAETSLDSSFAPLGGRNLSPLGALFLRHMPLQRRQAFPRLLLVDHRRHPPKSSERESQNLETGYRVSCTSRTCACERHAVSRDSWVLGRSCRALRRSERNLLSKPLSRAHAHLENGQLRRAGPDWTALRTPNRDAAFHAMTPSGAPVTFQPPMRATTASDATTRSVAGGRISAFFRLLWKIMDTNIT